jgi:hypothetical protein
LEFPNLTAIVSIINLLKCPQRRHYFKFHQVTTVYGAEVYLEEGGERWALKRRVPGDVFMKSDHCMFACLSLDKTSICPDLLEVGEVRGCRRMFEVEVKAEIDDYR